MAKRHSQPTQLWALFPCCLASPPSQWEAAGCSSIGAGGRIDGMLGGSGRPYQIYRQWHASDDQGSAGQTQRGQPERPPYQWHAWDDRGAAGQTHLGSARGRGLHYVGRNCPLLGIGRRSNRKRLVRLLSYGRGAGRIILGDPSPNRRFAHNLLRHIASRSRELRRSDIMRIRAGLAVGWDAWSAVEPSVGNVPDVGVGAGSGETVGAGLRSGGPALGLKIAAAAASEEVAVAVRSAEASL